MRTSMLSEQNEILSDQNTVPVLCGYDFKSIYDQLPFLAEYEWGLRLLLSLGEKVNDQDKNNYYKNSINDLLGETSSSILLTKRHFQTALLGDRDSLLHISMYLSERYKEDSNRKENKSQEDIYINLANYLQGIYSFTETDKNILSLPTITESQLNRDDEVAKSIFISTKESFNNEILKDTQLLPNDRLLNEFVNSLKLLNDPTFNIYSFAKLYYFESGFRYYEYLCSKISDKHGQQEKYKAAFHYYYSTVKDKYSNGYALSLYPFLQATQFFLASTGNKEQQDKILRPS